MQGFRQARPALAARLLLIFSCIMLSNAVEFSSFTKWMTGCAPIAASSNNTDQCDSHLAVVMNFVYSQTQGQNWGTDTASYSPITTACNTCQAPLQAAFSQAVKALASASQGSCALVPEGGSQLALLSAGMQRFACLGSSTKELPGGEGGKCVREISSALQDAGILQQARSFDPNLQFQNKTLTNVCLALQSSNVGCCARSWTYIMAALANQMCLPDLANEYIALIGRCEIALGADFPAFCTAGWDVDLLPLLRPPASCNTTLTASARQSFTGATCSTEQLGATKCFGNACDLWCAMLGTVQKTQDTVPSRSVIINNPSADVVGGTALAETASGKGKSLSVATIVIICIFSVLIALLLLALIVWRIRVAREFKEAQFAVDLPPPKTPEYPVDHPDYTTQRVTAPGESSPVPNITPGAGVYATPRYDPGPTAGAGAGSGAMQGEAITGAAATIPGDNVGVMAAPRAVMAPLDTPVKPSAAAGAAPGTPATRAEQATPGTPATPTVSVGPIAAGGAVAAAATAGAVAEAATTDHDVAVAVAAANSGSSAVAQRQLPASAQHSGAGGVSRGLHAMVAAGAMSGAVSSQADNTPYFTPAEGAVEYASEDVVRTMEAATDRLRAHQLSFSGSETTYYTAGGSNAGSFTAMSRESAGHSAVQSGYNTPVLPSGTPHSGTLSTLGPAGGSAGAAAASLHMRRGSELGSVPPLETVKEH